jgi:hypothetical protein
VTEYSERTSATPSDFVAALQDDLGRTLDSNSTLFFSGHPISVNLLHRTLTGQIAERNKEADSLFMAALLLDVEEAVMIADDKEWKRIRNGPDRNVSLMAAFGRHYPDAGWLVSKAINVYFGRK